MLLGIRSWQACQLIRRSLSSDDVLALEVDGIPRVKCQCPSGTHAQDSLRSGEDALHLAFDGAHDVNNEDIAGCCCTIRWTKYDEWSTQCTFASGGKTFPLKIVTSNSVERRRFVFLKDGSIVTETVNGARYRYTEANYQWRPEGEIYLWTFSFTNMKLTTYSPISYLD